MNSLQYKKILARRHSDEIVGRTAEKAMLVSHAAGTGGVLLLSAPRIGSTELLLQTFDELFYSGAVLPFYFAFTGDGPVRETARRFAIDLLTQLVAFRRSDPLLLQTSPTVAELERLSLPQDDELVEDILDVINSERSADEISFARSCFTLPLRVASKGLRAVTLLDDVHRAPEGIGAGEISDLLARSEVPYVMSARRRSLRSLYRLRRVHLEPVSFEAACQAAETAAQRMNLPIAEPVRDLTALRADGDLAVLHELIASAAERGEPLNSFRIFETVYASSIFGGGISALYERLFTDICPEPRSRKQVARLIADSLAGEGDVPISAWQKRSGLDETEFGEVIERLNIEELVRVSAGRVEAMRENRVLRDVFLTRQRLERGTETRAAVFADVLSAFIKTAPAEMAEHYRRTSAIGLKDVMERFRGKSVPKGLLDYRRFRDLYKGLPQDQLIAKVSTETERFPLPEIVFTAPTDAFYRAAGLLSERERSAIAVGFEQGDLGGENRTAWIAAEIDSKLEASENVAAAWCERLEMAAVESGFFQYRIWLVAPEGFAPEALDAIHMRNGIGSSRRQVEMLAEYLEKEAVEVKPPETEEYEIVIPMTADSEMVAARTLEDIARRHNIPAKEVNRIKTALVEACINATEHSSSPDRRIHQRFVVGPDSISIIISNRGIRLTDKPVAAEPSEGRRGWGLKLMRQLMDDVRIERVDDGTRISMTKYFQPA